MKVIVRIGFNDLTENVYRKVDDIFEVDKDRFDEIIKGLPSGYVDEYTETEKNSDDDTDSKISETKPITKKTKAKK